MARIKNLDRLISKLDNLKDVESAMKQACILVENEAKKNCPVDKGQLRNSITHEIDKTASGIEGSIGTNVEYAPYVEYGTGIFSSLGNGRQDKWSYKDAEGNWHTTIGQQPQPYLCPALDDNRKEIIDIFEKQIKKGVKIK